MIEIIVACGKQGEIGKDGKLLWSLKDDLKYFKEVTDGHTVVMGYETYKSIGKPLPNRRNIVISKKHKDELKEGSGVTCISENAVNQILKINNMFPSEKIFIIGGQSIYNMFADVASKLHITIVNAVFKDADRHFPVYRLKHADIKAVLKKEKDENNEYDFTTYLIERK
jgi:dihydrofolate reductase